MKTQRITTRTRSLGYASTSRPPFEAPAEPKVVGTRHAVRKALDGDRARYGNHEARSGHAGTRWVAYLYWKGRLVAEHPDDVLRVLDTWGHLTLTFTQEDT